MTADTSAEWPIGPPHEFAPRANIAPDAICTACGSRRDRAIHDWWYWSQQGIELVGATSYVKWKQDHDRR
jgi:hypothetical protein